MAMRNIAAGAPSRRPRPLSALFLAACAVSPLASSAHEEHEAGARSWDIDYVSFHTNFAPDGRPNLVVRYAVGTDRAHDTEALAGDCASPIEPAGVLSDPDVTRDQGELSDNLVLGYTVDMGLLAASNIWDEEKSRMALCQVVRLILPVEEGEGEPWVIAEDKHVLGVNVNFEAHFELAVKSEGGGAGGAVELPDEEAGK